MSEKLTLESVVEKLNCDCDTCKFEHDYQIDCKAARREYLKDLIKQILEQVRPLRATASMMFTKEQAEHYNFCVNNFDQNIKAFLETSK